jgi:hypothetical protein
MPDVPLEGIKGMSITLPTIPAGSSARYYFDMRFMTGVRKDIVVTLKATITCNLGTLDVYDTVQLAAPKGKV